MSFLCGLCLDGAKLYPSGCPECGEKPKDKKVYAHVVGFGSGAWVVNHGEYAGVPALFIEPAPVAGRVGDDAFRSGLPQNRVAKGGLILTFANFASASVVADELRHVISALADKP